MSLGAYENDINGVFCVKISSFPSFWSVSRPDTQPQQEQKTKDKPDFALEKHRLHSHPIIDHMQPSGLQGSRP